VRLIYFVPVTTLYRLMQAGLISPATIDQAIADLRSGVTTRSVLTRANLLEDPDQHIGRVDLDRLMRSYPGQPMAGTRMHRSHGRQRQVTRMPAAT
jgi:hypothetical protein